MSNNLHDVYSHNTGFLYDLDARVKVIFTLAFLFYLNLNPSKAWSAYILFLSVIITLLFYSRLSICYVLKRVLLAAPFIFTAVPLIFTGSDAQFPLLILNKYIITYSPEGYFRFLSIVIRLITSLLAAIILSSTTKLPDILSAFQYLHVPKIFITIIGLMWRYLYVLVDEAVRLMRARESRSAFSPDRRQKGGSILWRSRVSGGMVGNLFLRSLERSDRIYYAMLSRGFDGEQKTFLVRDFVGNYWIIVFIINVSFMIFVIVGILFRG